MNFPPKVVASVTSGNEAKEALALGADIVEVRVDLASGNPVSLVESIYSEYGCPIIVTIRPTYEGGQFNGTEWDRIKLFKKLVPYAAYIDVELRSPDNKELIGTVEGSEAVPIVSYHDFESTPPNREMLGIIDRCLDIGGIAKLAVMPHSLRDVLRLYEVTLSSDRPVCTIAMGDTGSHSRIMSCVYGSLLTYGFVSHPVAPGQLRVDRILEGLKILGLR